MGPAGREFVYKDELAGLSRERAARFGTLVEAGRAAGADEAEARREAEREVSRWFAGEDAKLVARYERDIMNPREALSLGSISQMVLPRDLRRLLADTVDLCMRHYEPSAMTGPQREFH